MPESYEAVIAVEGTRFIQLQRSFGDVIKARPVQRGDFVVMSNNPQGDRFWLKIQDSNWLVSLLDGRRKPIPIKGSSPFWFSPNGKYLVYYDIQRHQYFSYYVDSDKIKLISAGLPSSVFARHNEFRHPINKPRDPQVSECVGLAGWPEDSNYVFVYSDHDIWRLDLQGGARPINVTNGFGQKHSVKFRFLTRSQQPLLDLPLTQPLLLTAFNPNTKENGFYQVVLGGSGDPTLLTMGPYTYFHSNLGVMNPVMFDNGQIPIKAKDANVWIVKRQSGRESPNFYLTRDFKVYKPLTTIHPEQAYNWLNPTLIGWMQPDGNVTQGILYKPDNFDPAKRYPVIFVVYEQLSQRLHQFPNPDYAGAFINIPWFVSRGYLVFTPDIHFVVPKKGASALLTVSSGVKALAKYRYVDTSKLAIVGHSYSGVMINYIVTHSSLFSASIAGAGASDAISSALQLNGAGLEKGGSSLGLTEYRMGVSIWDRPDMYLSESPILNAHKVTTPLLLFHSMIDGLPWEQALEMFTALRRLGKMTWLIQYDDAGHEANGKDAEDYSKRITQYFDHYLKGERPPIWMTRGIRYSQRGIE
ncbi:MAG: S9 family peptidase, partial [Chitinophagaceae bacterium]|nr:S9 family peptidase [Chitinophagaceae bacterium]